MSKNDATVLKGERVKSTIGIETCSIEDSHSIVTDDTAAENNISATHGVTLSMEQQLTTRTALVDKVRVIG